MNQQLRAQSKLPSDPSNLAEDLITVFVQLSVLSGICIHSLDQSSEQIYEKGYLPPIHLEISKCPKGEVRLNLTNNIASLAIARKLNLKTIPAILSGCLEEFLSSNIISPTQYNELLTIMKLFD